MTSFRKRFCTVFVAIAATSALSGGLAGATPTNAVPSGGFYSLGIYPPLCDDASTSKSRDATTYAVASGRSVIHEAVELQLQSLVNGQWMPVADDGVEVFVNNEEFDGHDSLWAHARVSYDDTFEIRHYGPLDGHVVNYRLLLWQDGASAPTVWIHNADILFPSQGFCDEALAAGGTRLDS